MRSKVSQNVSHERTNTPKVSKGSLKRRNSSGMDEEAGQDGYQPGKRSKKSQSPNSEPTNSPEPQLAADEDQISPDEVRPVISPLDYLFSYNLLFLFGNMDLNSQPEH